LSGLSTAASDEPPSCDRSAAPFSGVSFSTLSAFARLVGVLVAMVNPFEWK
jgi:hypothetical protein